MRKLVGRILKRDLSVGSMRLIEYPPFHVLLVNLAGVPYAIEDSCNHAGESLSKGELRGSCITCPAHGYSFDMRTGALKSPRGLCADQRTFEVEEEGEELAVYDRIPSVVV